MLRQPNRSRTARRKTECNTTWFFLMVMGDRRPSAVTMVTHDWTVDGMIRAIGRSPKNYADASRPARSHRARCYLPNLP